jgi:hypothetical protein
MKDRTPADQQGTRRRQSSPVSVHNKILSRMEKEHNKENHKSSFWMEVATSISPVENLEPKSYKEVMKIEKG